MSISLAYKALKASFDVARGDDRPHRGDVADDNRRSGEEAGIKYPNIADRMLEFPATEFGAAPRTSTSIIGPKMC